MPQTAIGQLITFTTDQTANETFSKWVTVNARHNDTVAAIAARRGHPEEAASILALNGNVRGANHLRLRSPQQKLIGGTQIRLPGTLAPPDTLNVLVDDTPPIVKDGYANYDTVVVPGRRGITRFLGYNPVVMDVAIRWEVFAGSGDGHQVEKEIATLERMAGMTTGAGGIGPRIGPPAVVKVNTTDNQGNMVPLVPATYQFAPGKASPVYRISSLAWDANPLRGDDGYRVRQKCVVGLMEFTPISIVQSASTRSNVRNYAHAKPKKKKKKK